MFDALTYPAPRDGRVVPVRPPSLVARDPAPPEAYFASVLVGAVAAVSSQAQLFNRGGSGRRIIIDRVTATMATTGLIYLLRGGLALTNLETRWRSTGPGQYIGVGELRTDQAAFPSLQTMQLVRRLADTPYEFRDLHVRLEDDEGLLVAGGLNNVAVTVTFRGWEYPI
jgi:hypothetical protein